MVQCALISNAYLKSSSKLPLWLQELQQSQSCCQSIKKKDEEKLWWWRTIFSWLLSKDWTKVNCKNAQIAISQNRLFRSPKPLLFTTNTFSQNARNFQFWNFQGMNVVTNTIQKSPFPSIVDFVSPGSPSCNMWIVAVGLEGMFLK